MSGIIFYDREGVEIRIKHDGTMDKQPQKVRLLVDDCDSSVIYYFETVSELDEFIAAMQKARDDFKKLQEGEKK